MQLNSKRYKNSWHRPIATQIQVSANNNICKPNSNSSPMSPGYPSTSKRSPMYRNHASLVTLAMPSPSPHPTLGAKSISRQILHVLIHQAINSITAFQEYFRFPH